MQVPGTALLVEDDPGVAATLRGHLTRAGFTVYEARSERDAVRRVEEIAPDVVILDLALENGGGTGACRRIRELPSGGDVPVLVLSAESDVTAKLALFELGADDVVASTCDPTELLARVRAILRRGADRQTIRRIGPLRIALATGDAWLAERQLELSRARRELERDGSIGRSPASQDRGGRRRCGDPRGATLRLRAPADHGCGGRSRVIATSGASTLGSGPAGNGFDTCLPSIDDNFGLDTPSSPA